jgi:hypothetical protein
MQIEALDDLSPTEIRAIVINVRTELVSTLALASVKKYSDCPVLLINCEPTESSRAYMGELSNQFGFDVLNWPARPHGHALDQLFQESKDTFLWLVDSDSEIMKPSVFPRILSDLRCNEGVFGAGYVQGPGWLTEKEKTGDGNALYQERPWIPCAAFRVSHLREAIEHKVSFIDRTIRDEIELSVLRFGTTDFDAIPIDLIYCDTGADIYQWNKHVKDRVFLGPNVAVNSDVNHYHGVTRLFVAPAQTNGARLDEISKEIKEKLINDYHFDFDEFAAKATAGIVV